MTYLFSNPETDRQGEVARILLVDDNLSTCKALRFFLESIGYETLVFNDPEQFLQEVDGCDGIGCILLDVRMPKMSGLEVLEVLQQRRNALPVIILTGHGDVEMAVRALKQGAMDFLMKPPKEDDLLKAIDQAVRKSRENLSQRERFRKFRSMFDSLTSRERDVARLVAQGLLNKIIADKLSISEKTVQQHRGVVYKKLGIKNAVEAAEVLRIIDSESMR